VNVAVLGAGAGGRGVAVLCARRGCDVVLCERFEALRRQVAGGLVRHAGVLGEGTVRVRVTDEPAEAAAHAGLVFVATTAAGQRWALDGVAAAGASDQTVVVLSGLMGSILGRDQREERRRLIGETSAFPLSARIVGDHCHIRRAFRPSVAALPGPDGPRLAARLDGVLDVRPARSIIETCLCNPNPLVHAGTMLLNLAYVEREGLHAAAAHEGITSSGIRLIDALDAERRAIGVAYGYALPSVDGLYEALSDRRPPFRASEPVAPLPLQARFLTEDVPYGLALWASLAAAARVQTPVMDAIMRLYAVVAPELLGQARTLAALGVPASSVAEAIAAVNGGVHEHR
jgi:opine dehydrogenase